VKIPGFGCHVLLSCAAAAVLTGCGGSQPPIGAPGAMPQTSAIATHADRGKSWMLAEAKSEKLLYVVEATEVTIFSYPQGISAGRINGIGGGGACSDANGDVFLVSREPSRVYEYAHGGKKPIQTLTAATAPLGCAVDPTTGNLAVATEGLGSSGDGANILVFAGARGKPKSYTNAAFISFAYCGFDDKGNLFVDGFSYPGNSGDFLFGELLKGGTALKVIKLAPTVFNAGGVQWDGSYIVVGDRSHPRLYRYTIKGDRGTLVSTTHLDFPRGKGNSYYDFSIQDDELVQSDDCPSCKVGPDVNFFSYPTGGRRTKNIVVGPGGPLGVAVSLAQTEMNR
jgi:hypothetical protein